jgi:glycosyltransferase involved in cell wall biosynthesis
MRLLVLYSEIAGYFLACVEEYARRFGDVHLVRWPVHKDAPFRFQEIPGVTFYERNDYDYRSLLKLCEELNPDILYVTGWLDPVYLKVAKQFHKRGVPAICTLDNQWKGSFRQRMGALLSPLYLHNKFTHIGVPGMYQFEFARRLGYPREKIITGMYAADTQLFHQAFLDTRVSKAQNYPKRLLYVGRMVDFKGIEDLTKAFLAVAPDHGWELWLAGTGPLEKSLPRHPSIKHLGFVQPSELPGLARDCGAFVLPSRVEPWGVVMHEFASAGLPIIGSDVCGSSVAFLRSGYNGFQFKAGNVPSLQNALQRLFSTPADELMRMGERSQQLSQQITTLTWATSISGVLLNT